ELGGDSIVSIQVVSRARRLGYTHLQVVDLFDYQTIDRLSSIMTVPGRGGQKENFTEENVLQGNSGLLPVQQWFFGQEGACVSHFNQSVLLGLDKRVSAEALQVAVAELLRHHDALRFRYRRTAGVWEQEYMPYTGKVSGSLVVEETGDRELVARAGYYQRSLQITEGDLFRAVLFLTGAEETQNRLLLVIHHLVVDGVSWRILLEDLELLITEINKYKNERAEDMQAGLSSCLGKKSASYGSWYESLVAYGNRMRVVGQTGYWESVTSQYRPLRVDRAGDDVVRHKDMGVWRVRLGEEQTLRLLQEAPRAYHTEINDLLLAALGRQLCRWSGRQSVVIGLEGHGREEIGGVDASRTVGWFTSVYPVALTAGSGLQEGSLIRGVKEQIRQIEDKGLGYGVLKYIRGVRSLQGVQPWDLVFNYMGRLDNVVKGRAWFRGAQEEVGDTVSEEHVMTERMIVNGMVQGGELVIQWWYSRLHYTEETIRELAEGYVETLSGVIDHCCRQAQTGRVHSPSDYGLVGVMSCPELDRFLEEPAEEGAKKRAEEGKGRPRGEGLTDLYRLSGLQEGMLFHSLFDNQAGAY
ncbi:condensation domain-containing protein, partial [Flavitalea flava]